MSRSTLARPGSMKVLADVDVSTISFVVASKRERAHEPVRRARAPTKSFLFRGPGGEVDIY